MLALIAAQEAASIASGHGSPLTAPVGTGTLDGFAAGMLLSGVVFLLILAQRRALRRPAGKGAAARATAATAGSGAAAAPAAPAHSGPAHSGLAHSGPVLVQDPALGLYPAPGSVLAAPVLAAPVHDDLPPPLPDLPASLRDLRAPYADLRAPLADLPASVGDTPAQLTDLPAPLPSLSAPLADLPAPLADPFMTASFEGPEVGEQIGPALSTHPYADVSPFAGASAPARFMPFADAANEVVLQPGVRLEEWLEGEMRRPSLPKRIPASASAPARASVFEATPSPTEPGPTEPATIAPAANVPSAVAAAEATTAVVPVTPAAPPTIATTSDSSAEPDLADESGHHRRAPAYQSKHRLVGRNDSKPWPDNQRRSARHAAASPTRSGAKGRIFGLRQLRPVSAGD